MLDMSDQHTAPPSDRRHQPTLTELPTATVLVLSGPSAGSEYEFATTILLGRANADLEIMDPEISRRHLQLTPTVNGVELIDLDSANGTWVEGRELTDAETLERPTQLRIGKTLIEVTPSL
jgi:S-DNA-T family DNA segregation ATPase FtsK/SpoIIIE